MSGLDFYRGKRVFITGHTGFKGTWLCRSLLNAGSSVTGYALMPEAGRSLFVETGTAKDMDSIEGDIRDFEKLCDTLRKARAEIVFHLAAQPIVRRSYREPRLTYETNVMGTVNTLEATRETDSVRSFVNVTTDKVYANNEWCWPCRENETLDGYDPYSNSKSCSELVTAAYRRAFFGEENIAVSTARAGNVIGGGDYSEDRIIPDCVRAAMTGKNIVVRNPCSTRPYQHVLDCLSGYLLLAEKQYECFRLAGSYNFGPESEAGSVSTGALADMFCEAWGGGLSWTAESGGVQPHEAATLKLDISKAKSYLGWRPRWDIKKALSKTVEYAKRETDSERLTLVEQQIHEYFGG